MLTKESGDVPGNEASVTVYTVKTKWWYLWQGGPQSVVLSQR